jgi:type II secretory pathway pseudopilin PulG
MRNTIDFSSWQGVLSTLLGLVVVSLVAVGIRLLVMHSVQQRRERQNRQINERLKTLIAAYKTLGGSFTGDLDVDPTHRRDLRMGADVAAVDANETTATSRPDVAGSDRRRRIRDAVEAALSDVILLGTHEQVSLAAKAANEMVAGRPVRTGELVVSLRTFIREVLDLDSISDELEIPKQGPTRASGTSARSGRSEQAGGGKAGGAGMTGGEGVGGAVGGAVGGSADGVHRSTMLDVDGHADHAAGS